MPVPTLLIDRELELGREVTAKDFTEPEREEILGMLPRCLRDAHTSLRMWKILGASTNESLRAAEWVGVLQDLLEEYTNAKAEADS